MYDRYDDCLFLVFYEFNSATSDWNCSRKIKVLPLFAIGRNTYFQSTNNEYVSRIYKAIQDCFHLFAYVFFSFGYHFECRYSLWMIRKISTFSMAGFKDTILNLIVS